MIKIKLNEEKYRYQVYHIFSLFYFNEEILFQELDCNYDILIHENYLEINEIDKKNNFQFEDELTIKENIKKIIYTFLKDKEAKDFPWGTLIGIRPSKIAMELIEKGAVEKEIINHYNNHYLANKEKAELCYSIAKVSKSILDKGKDKISIYIGMPFCPTRCSYCSFASNPINKYRNLVSGYLKSIKLEIDLIGKLIKEKKLIIDCVYFGGGTPTSINDNEFDNLMEYIYNKFIKGNDIREFNVECGRVDSLSERKFEIMKKYSVTRISINPQTMNDDTLKLVGRNHTSEDVVKYYKLAKSYGFDNINMDLIIGLPGETIEHVKKTCNKILSLNPESITIHGLAYKKGSKLYEYLINNKIDSITKVQEIKEMYEETKKLCSTLEMKPYYMYKQKNMIGNMENIGYSKCGKEGIYNIEMIEERQNVIAIGVDAVSKFIFEKENRIERLANTKDVSLYIERIEEVLRKKEVIFNKLF